MVALLRLPATDRVPMAPVEIELERLPPTCILLTRFWVDILHAGAAAAAVSELTGPAIVQVSPESCPPILALRIPSPVSLRFRFSSKSPLFWSERMNFEVIV